MIRTVKKASERRSDIISAARHLFQSKGYDKTTMQDVIERLGIAKGTIYHYFPSKEVLLEAVVEDIVNINIELMHGRIEKMDGNALEKLRVLIKGSNIAEANEGILESLHKPGNEALHTRLLAVTIVKHAPLYAMLIQQGCNEGIFQTEAPLECAEFMLAGFQFLIDRGIYDWTQEDIKRRLQAFPRLIEQQLKAEPGSFQFMIKDINV